MTQESESNKISTLAAQHLVMYPDLNPGRRLFGGALIKWIDEASALFAMKSMGTQRITTKKFSEIIFHSSGHLGDLIEIWCQVVAEGNTSLTLECRVVVTREGENQTRLICQCTVVLVAIDDEGKPRVWKKKG